MAEYSAGWDDHYRRHGRAWAGTVRNRQALPTGANVLEAGCGNGKHLEGLLNENLRVTAFDFSRNAVAECRKNLCRHPGYGNAEIVGADCRDLPFRDSVFDVAFYRHVTGHLTEADRKRSADECRRVLKKDGILYFTGFSTGDMRAGKGIETEKNSYLKGNGIMTHCFSEEEVRDLFSDLEEISIETEEWTLRIRGTDHMRAEINGVFKKTG